jgi:hypothetical protein
VKRRRLVLWALIGYVFLSILGWFSAERLFHAAPMAYILAQWILGPLAFAFNLHSEAIGESLIGVWIVFYLAATVLLAIAVMLFRHRSRFIKGIAVVLGALTWLASGFMNFAVMIRGI